MDGLTPSPAAPAPETAAAPVAEPTAPVIDPTSAPDPEAAEAAEWDAAREETFGLKKEPKDEPAKPAEDAKTKEAKEPDPNETPEQKAAREAEEAAEENEPADTTARDSRLAARQSAQQVAEVRSDVREKMFADVPTELKDADGDPIKSIEDVTRLLNPRTGVAFTEDEAATWLLSAQQQFNANLASTEKQIEAITEVNIALKDEADIITSDYGELLKAMPELRDKVWTEFSKTFTKDDKSGIITKAPVSLESFYRMALEPYANLARQMETQEAAKAAALADSAAAEAAAKRATRADRSDIYTGGKADLSTDEDKEWAAAATEVFGPLKK